MSHTRESRPPPGAPHAGAPRAASMTAGLCFSVAAAGLASPLSHGAPVEQPAGQCLGNLRAYDALLQKNGYWLHGSGYGYDYPMAQQDAGARAAALDDGAPGEVDYWHVRPGYEIRTLIAAANVLAQRGQQHECESLLGDARTIYNGYAAAPHAQEAPKAVDGAKRRGQQIAAAQPVGAFDATLRVDQLMGTEVSNPSNQGLGSVADIVLSPRTGKIAYLLIGRGGFFGIDEAYIPVPWKDFKTPPDTSLLVLNTTQEAMDAAPRVKDRHLSNIYRTSYNRAMSDP